MDPNTPGTSSGNKSAFVPSPSLRARIEAQLAKAEASRQRGNNSESSDDCQIIEPDEANSYGNHSGPTGQAARRFVASPQLRGRFENYQAILEERKLRADLAYQRGQLEALFQNLVNQPKSAVRALVQELISVFDGDKFPDPDIYSPIIRFTTRDANALPTFDFIHHNQNSPFSLVNSLHNMDQDILDLSSAIYELVYTDYQVYLREMVEREKQMFRVGSGFKQNKNVIAKKNSVAAPETPNQSRGPPRLYSGSNSVVASTPVEAATKSSTHKNASAQEKSPPKKTNTPKAQTPNNKTTHRCVFSGCSGYSSAKKHNTLSHVRMAHLGGHWTKKLDFGESGSKSASRDPADYVKSG